MTDLSGVQQIFLNPAQLAALLEHARACAPNECCGLLGGDRQRGAAQSVYRLRNVAGQPLSNYEAAPEDLFAAQRAMRANNETLLAIYHSHPRAVEPVPSPSDVASAYYPDAAYLIVTLAAAEPKVGAFRIDERLRTWQRIELAVAPE